MTSHINAQNCRLGDHFTEKGDLKCLLDDLRKCKLKLFVRQSISKMELFMRRLRKGKPEGAAWPTVEPEEGISNAFVSDIRKGKFKDSAWVTLKLKMSCTSAF